MKGKWTRYLDLKKISRKIDFRKAKGKINKKTIMETCGKLVQSAKTVRFKSVGMKLFAIFFISILFFVFAVGFTSYSISKNVIQNKVAEASQQTMVQGGQKLDFLLSIFLELSRQVALDTDMDQYIVDYNNALKNKGGDAVNEARQKMRNKLNLFLYFNENVRAIHVFNPNGSMLVSTDSASQSANVGNEGWFKDGVAKDKIAWLPPTEKGFFNDSGKSGSTFGLIRTMKSRANETQAVLLMEISTAVVEQELENINLGEKGNAMLVTDKNKVVTTKDHSLLEADSPVPLPETAFAEASGHLNDSKSDLLLAYSKSKETEWYLVGSMPLEELVKDAKSINTMTWIMAFIAMVIAVIIGYFVARMIGRPIAEIRNLMKEGENGNLKVRTDIKSEDEIGQLGSSFNQMMEKITQLVQQTTLSAQEVLATSSELADASRKTETAAREIAVATEEIAKGATSLAVESEKGNELTSQIGVQMKAVVQTNVQMGTAASEVYRSSEQGIEYMADLISKTNKTEQMTRSMVEKVDKLKESTSSIRKILDLLNNLSKQTNILSLNATIEAARAGAAGKGFMVVADEIRKLADQSRQSIEVVGQITETIQHEIDETVNVLSTASPIFKEQIDSVKEADEIFKQVQGHMGGFIHKLEAVTESIQKLDQSQNVLSDAMSNVSAVAQQSTATSEEVASLSNEELNISIGLVKLAEKLEDLSNSLKDSLSKFQV